MSRRATKSRRRIALKPGSSDLSRRVLALRKLHEEQRGQAIIQFGRLFREAQRTGEFRDALVWSGHSRRTAFHYMALLELNRSIGLNAREIGATDLVKLLELKGRTDRAGKAKWIRAANSMSLTDFLAYADRHLVQP
jgi:hypothetical protein